MREYWNHNTAYHPWILRAAARVRARDVLDVGCGDGLLLQRLAHLVASDAVQQGSDPRRSLTGIEPDPATADRARARLAGAPHTTVVQADFASFAPRAGGYDFVAFVATLHHMDPRASLARAVGLLRPGGVLIVVALTANRSALDWMLAGLALPFAKIGSLLHRETPDIGVPISAPRESLAELRALAAELLPGAQIRRGLYYRVLISWRKPEQ